MFLMYNHRIKAFTSKTSNRGNGNDQHHNCNDPKSDKHDGKELTGKEQHIGFARKQSREKEARSADAIPFQSSRAGMRRQAKEISPEG
jgi:hypothetical protein